MRRRLTPSLYGNSDGSCSGCSDGGRDGRGSGGGSGGSVRESLQPPKQLRSLLHVHTVAMSSNPWQSMAIHANRWQSVAISGNQWQSVASSGNQWQSVETHLHCEGSDYLAESRRSSIHSDGIIRKSFQRRLHLSDVLGDRPIFDVWTLSKLYSRCRCCLCCR